MKRVNPLGLTVNIFFLVRVLVQKIFGAARRLIAFLLWPIYRLRYSLPTTPLKINLCSGNVNLENYVNVDISPAADVRVDLSKMLLPFPAESADTVICISAINYFTFARGKEILTDVYRVMKPGGILRIAVQDLQLFAKHYLDRDQNFYFQKNPNGSDRFAGNTFAEKFSGFFNGYSSNGFGCQAFYDVETLSKYLDEIGFKNINKKACGESAIHGTEKFDNRPDQMFFLEANK